MAKYRNQIFWVLIGLVILGVLYQQLTNKNQATQKIQQYQTTKDLNKVKNTAKKAHLSIDKDQVLTVGKDLQAGYYDLSVTSGSLVLSTNLLTIEQGNPASQLLLAKGDQVQLKGIGEVDFQPSRLSKLEQVTYKGKQVYRLPSQGYYYSESQLPLGTYKLDYDNLPTISEAVTTSNGFANIQLATLAYDNQTANGLQIKSANVRVGQQDHPEVTLKAGEGLLVLYQLPPKDLQVYLERVGA